jgi:hypothetical protein
MAKRGGRKSGTQRRRRQQGISILKTAEAIALANVATQTLFNVNPVEFVIGNDKGMTAKGLNAISMRELFQQMQTGGNVLGRAGSGSTTAIISQNLKANAVNGVIGMILVPAGFRVGKQLAKPAINSINNVLKNLRLSGTVRL